MNLEEQIISGFVFSEEFCRKVLPFTKPIYFEDHSNQIIVSTIQEYFNKYNKVITKDILEVEVLARKDLSQNDAKFIPAFVQSLENKDTNAEWLVNQAESYYQKRAVYLAILDSIEIIDGKNGKLSEDAIPSLLQEALSVTFDMNVGHDYLENAEERFDSYHSKEEGIPFDIDLLNEITDGVGLRKKTLTCIAAQTGGGKSILMCHIAANALKQGKNVLYVTAEMSEEKIAQRIDANMMNTPVNELKDVPHDIFINRIEKIKAKTEGKLIVKEYPTSTAHAGHIRALIEELKAKKNFKPDLICIDYLNIFTSQRVRNAQANSYTIMKSVAEELRALMIENDCPGVTATQLNRGGIGTSDVDMTDTSESMGIVHALDLYLALIRTEELDDLGQAMIKQLKNRYGDVSRYRTFVVGMDAARMKFHNVEQAAQQGFARGKTNEDDDTPAFDKSSFGKRIKADGLKF